MNKLSSTVVMLTVCMVLGLPKVFASSAEEQKEGLETLEKVETTKGKDFSSSLNNSYYAVGEQYDKCGKKIKAESFKKMAKEKNPNCAAETVCGEQIFLKPLGDSQKKDLLGKEGSLLSNEKTSAPSKISMDTDTLLSLVQCQFSRFVRGILGENLSLLDKLIAPVVSLNEQELEKSDLLAAFDHIFSQVNFENLCPKDLYNNDINNIQAKMDEIGAFIDVEAIEREDFRSLPFWKKHQRFYFKSDDKGNWLLVKIEARS